MPSLPTIVVLSGLALFLFKQLVNQPIKAPEGEDFLIQDYQSPKITDVEVIKSVQSGMLGFDGTKPGGAQYW